MTQDLKSAPMSIGEAEPALAVARVDGAEISYGLLGHGPRPIYLMHGGLGLDHTSLRPWLDPLAEGSTLVYYDHRGNGRSSREGVEAVDHARWAADAEGLRAELGHERIVLLGHSYGAFLALEYAARYPARLAALVLIGAAPKFDYGDEIARAAQARGTPEQLAALGQAGARDAASDAEFRALWNTILPMYFHRPDPAVLAAMDRRTRYSAPAFNRSFRHTIATYDVTAELPELRVPTLVVSGDDDWITPRAQNARVAAALPGAVLAGIDQAGHFPFVEQQAATLDAIQRFLGGLR